MTIDLLNAEELHHLRRTLDKSQKIITVCHTNADGDAIGSMQTWAEYLRQQGKDVTVIAPDMYPDFLQWMPGNDRIIRFDKKREIAENIIRETDLICLLDLNDLNRATEEMGKVLKDAGKPFMLIDHHLNPNVRAEVKISYPHLSSTSEIVFRLIWQLGGYDSMTKEMAITTYCGMMTDTGGFTYNSTNPEIYFIISQLLAKGIDKDKIYRNIYHVFSIDRIRLTGYVLYQKLKVLTPLHASYYTISKEEQRRFHFIKGDAEGLVNLPLQIKGHKLSISLREDTEKPNLVWVSLRSVDNFPCNKLAEQFFNGGGHKNASGGKLFCTLKEAEQKAREAIQAYAKML